MAVNRLSKKDRSLTFERNNNKRIYKIKLKIFERKKKWAWKSDKYVNVLICLIEARADSSENSEAKPLYRHIYSVAGWLTGENKHARRSDLNANAQRFNSTQQSTQRTNERTNNNNNNNNNKKRDSHIRNENKHCWCRIETPSVHIFQYLLSTSYEIALVVVRI